MKIPLCSFFVKSKMSYSAIILVLNLSCTGIQSPIYHECKIAIENWKIYNSENSGLINNSTIALAIDNNDNLWVGMFHNGLVKFDGINWTVYNTQNSDLPSDSIWCTEVDLNNNLWVGTTKGLAKYDGNNWTIYNTSNSLLPCNAVYSLSTDKNNVLWIGCLHGTRGGFLKLDGNNWQLYTTDNSLLPSSIINVIHVDKNDNKWIGTGGGIVKVGANNSWRVYNKDNSGLIYYSVDAITSDLEGNIWIGQTASALLDYNYYHGALLRFDGNNWKDFRPNRNGIYNPDAIVSNRLFKMACDRYNYLWIATEAEWQFDYNLSVFKNGLWQNLSDMSPGFPHPFIRDILINNNNTVWLATQVGVISIQYSCQ